jgi:hypothetical protein
MGGYIMDATDDVPYFTLHHGEQTKNFSLCIALDGQVIHHIPNIRSFIRYLGFSELPVLPHEKKMDLIQDKTILGKLKEIDHSKDVDIGSNTCLQYKITEYLFTNNEQFKNECSEYYSRLIGTCKSLKIIDSKKCDNCIMLNKSNA